MTKKIPSEPERTTNSNPNCYCKHHARTISHFSFYSPKLSTYLLALCVVLFILSHINSLQTVEESSPSPPIPSSSWVFMQQWQKVIMNTSLSAFSDCSKELKAMASKLREAVTFLPLKDLSYSNTALQGHTWFMSNMNDTHEEGEVQYQQFPSEASKGRLLCMKGHDTHDGSRNYYALAWPETLPYNATLVEGLTFISYNHYDYYNIWHGLSAMGPFVAWHIKNQCAAPNRWILYHWGEVRTDIAPWLRTLMEITYGEPLHIETFDEYSDDSPVCFENAVVMRHNEGGMSRQRRMEVYDLMRCKARMYCNVSLQGRLADVNEKGLPVIGLTLLMRIGARSFKNESAVISIFEKECKQVEGCRLMVTHSSNLTFCDQVKLMSLTDILVSPHGAQLTNLFFMDRNSSIMELFPKGWLKLAGVGQYVFQWMASWSGMKHQGVWRDPDGDNCPYSDDERRCMSLYKNGKIGYNETHFSNWARNVLTEVRMRKSEETSRKSTSDNSNICVCN